jgi:hypothetical protein
MMSTSDFRDSPKFSDKGSWMFGLQHHTVYTDYCIRLYDFLKDPDAPHSGWVAACLSILPQGSKF